MENKEVFNNVLKIVNNAAPGKCKFSDYARFADCNTKHNYIIIRNYREEFIEIHTQTNNNKHFLHVITSVGGSLIINITDLEYLTLQSEILKCVDRFNSSINSFCELFYE